jgi:hypothetical protein
MHKENRKRLKEGKEPLTVLKFQTNINDYHGYWDKSGRWVPPTV